jgi:ABC-type nitrate/sulfonate/bicarbonate transport system permease component
LIGWPLLMLLPALRLEHRRLTGWIFAVAAAVATSDVVDTFSHLHTPLLVSLLRVINGTVIGCIVGVLLIAIYRVALATRPARD